MKISVVKVRHSSHTEQRKGKDRNNREVSVSLEHLQHKLLSSFNYAQRQRELRCASYNTHHF